MNDAADQSIRAQQGMASGSIVIKENYMPDKTLGGLTVMYKVQGYDPADGDWYWVKYAPDGAVDASGMVAMCISCHERVESNEYLFTGNVVNNGEVPASGEIVSFTQRIQPIFNAKCAACHEASSDAGFLALTSDASYTNLVNKPATRTGSPPAGTLVIPGNSAGSVLFQRISGIGLPAGEGQISTAGGTALSTGGKPANRPQVIRHRGLRCGLHACAGAFFLLQ